MTKRQKQSTISHPTNWFRNSQYVRHTCPHTNEVALPCSKMEMSGAYRLLQGKQLQLCSESQSFGVHLKLQTALPRQINTGTQHVLLSPSGRVPWHRLVIDKLFWHSLWTSVHAIFSNGCGCNTTEVIWELSLPSAAPVLWGNLLH